MGYRRFLWNLAGFRGVWRVSMGIAPVCGCLRVFAVWFWRIAHWRLLSVVGHMLALSLDSLGALQLC